MMKQSPRLVFALIAAGLAGCQQTETVSNPPPAHTIVVRAADVHEAYDDRTWDWEDGAGYFAKSGDFEAWTEAGGTAAYATGFWWVTDQGRLCFDGNWRTKEGANSSVTCFDHRANGKFWYQRRGPSGPWYIFKSDPPASTDEFAKLKMGDQVEPKLQALEASIGASAP
jgi:hypothetical protein